MRMKMYHTDLRKMFTIFGREEFTRTRFINKFADGEIIPSKYGKAMRGDGEASDTLNTLLRHKLIIYTNKTGNYYMHKMRISAKAIFEMNEVFEDFPEQPTDEDYSEYALLNLTEN